MQNINWFGASCIMLLHTIQKKYHQPSSQKHCRFPIALKQQQFEENRSSVMLCFPWGIHLMIQHIYRTQIRSKKRNLYLLMSLVTCNNSISATVSSEDARPTDTLSGSLSFIDSRRACNPPWKTKGTSIIFW